MNWGGYDSSLPRHGHRDSFSFWSWFDQRKRLISLVGLLLFTIWCHLCTHSPANKAARAFSEMGGKVERDEKHFHTCPLAPVIGINLNGTEVTDTDLKNVNRFTKLQKLQLRETQITDAGLKELRDLRTLFLLDLSATKITDAGLKELKALKSLAFLDLRNTQVSDAGLKDVKQIRALRKIAIGCTRDHRCRAVGAKALHAHDDHLSRSMFWLWSQGESAWVQTLEMSRSALDVPPAACPCFDHGSQAPSRTSWHWRAAASGKAQGGAD